MGYCSCFCTGYVPTEWGVGTFTPHSPHLTGTILEMGDLFPGTWCVSSPMVTTQSWSQNLVFSLKVPKYQERKTGRQKQKPSAQRGPIMYSWAVIFLMVTENWSQGRGEHASSHQVRIRTFYPCLRLLENIPCTFRDFLTTEMFLQKISKKRKVKSNQPTPSSVTRKGRWYQSQKSR